MSNATTLGLTERMERLRKTLALVLAALTAAPSGCGWSPKQPFKGTYDPAYDAMAMELDLPAESPCTLENNDASLAAPPPVTINDESQLEYQDVSLAEVIQIAMANSEVIRNLGGAAVEAPAATRTTLDAAIAESDPRFGPEAALSDFDAQFISSIFFEKNDRALNNEFFGGGTRLLLQDASVFQAAITKRAATGSQFTIRHNIDYDANNAPGNFLPSAWNTNIETEFRQPFLQGAGLHFNRIAGPFSTPGVYNGVLVARINTDVTLTNFEIAVRDLVSNLENAYWDLYFGYRDLDTKIKARDAALDTWRKIYALYEANRRGGEAEKEAQAREQYFRFQEEVQNALSGLLIDGTRTGNGSMGGTFRPSGGVLVAERKLRVLMGLPPTDCKLLRPSDEPIMAEVDFDWEHAKQEAVSRRAELRRQKWFIRRRELELIASKNFLLPQLDAVGRYRWRGFGKDLAGNESGGLGRFDSAYGDLATGDFQEWQLGLELSVPIGFRRAHAGVRNAELWLARDRALLRDQQLEVIHELSDSVAEMDRAFTVSKTGFNRLVAARQQLGAVSAAYEADKITLDVLLESQRQLAAAESRYYALLAEYAIAIKNVHFVKGTLLDYDGVYLAEGPWPLAAYRDAAELESRRGKPRELNYASSKSPALSWGPLPQEVDPGVVEAPHHGEVLPAPTEEDLPAPAPGTPKELVPTTLKDKASSSALTQASLKAPADKSAGSDVSTVSFGAPPMRLPSAAPRAAN